MERDETISWNLFDRKFPEAKLMVRFVYIDINGNLQLKKFLTQVK